MHTDCGVLRFGVRLSLDILRMHWHLNRIAAMRVAAVDAVSALLLQSQYPSHD
jgi:hypothetical protein